MNTVLASYQLPSGQRIELVEGDITTETVDAIVNAANHQLMHGGGVAAVIARKGGRQINEESVAWVQEHGPVTHNQPAYTNAGELPCKYVIHAVGPAWGSGKEKKKLSAAVKGSLQLATKLEVQSIAFPAISTGIFGYPAEEAAQVIFKEIRRYFKDTDETTINQVRVTLFDEEKTAVFQEVWGKLFPE
ncbi:MAG: macro domain-containing protein [Chloroflexota bacterium]